MYFSAAKKYVEKYHKAIDSELVWYQSFVVMNK